MQLSGKKAVFGLKLGNPSQFAVDATKDRALVYFDVDSLLDEVVPPSNLVVNSSWVPFRIASNDNVTFNVNTDGSILAAGGDGGHAGVYQAIKVKANKNYKIDMKVVGSGATDTWFEVFVGTVAPAQGSDYSNGGARLAINTWAGCGKSPFNGLLSVVKCAGSGSVVKFTTAGTVYVVIKCGGANLGTDGIRMSNIDFRRAD